MMKSIEGRESDLITTPNGDIVVVQFFTVLFKNIEGVDQFQVIQEKIDHLSIKIVKNSKFRHEDLDLSVKQIQHKVGENVRVNVDFVDDIQ